MARCTTLLAATGLSVALLVWAPPAPVSAQDDVNPYQAAPDVRAGRGLFERHCSRCHGLSAEGGETGPDLTTGQFRHASTDTGLFMVLQRGVNGTEMPPFRRARNDQQIWQVVAYLRTLSGGPRVEVPGDPDAGRRIYEGKGECTTCHMIAGRGGRQGPDLSRIGERRSPSDLLSDLVAPNERVQPAYWRMDVTHVDGTRVRGRRMDEGTYSVRILDEDDNMWSLNKSDLSRSVRIETSSMPSYLDRLSEQELEDLVAYLYGLIGSEG